MPVRTRHGDLAAEDADARVVWRVGYAPDPWRWTPWEYATDGRFNGRWDDPEGRWRSVYAGDSALACFLEVLATFRPDLELLKELDEVEDEDVGSGPPTAPPGVVPRSWCAKRRLGRACLTGTYAVPTSSISLPALRSRFGALAAELGLSDVDAATLRDSAPRALTQAVAAWLYQDPAVAGVRFWSRHGDELGLWTIFERPEDHDTSALLTTLAEEAVDPDDPALTQAMHTHRLQWDH